MNPKQIARFRYEGFDYQINHYTYKFNGDQISLPHILVTTKSSKKKRGKFPIKGTGHFQLTELKNPITLYRKVYDILDKELKDYQYVCFYPHDDQPEKRIKMYEISLKKMGFITLFKNEDYVFMGRHGYEMKKKNVIPVLWELYNSVFT